MLKIILKIGVYKMKGIFTLKQYLIRIYMPNKINNKPIIILEEQKPLPNNMATPQETIRKATIIVNTGIEARKGI